MNTVRRQYFSTFRMICPLSLFLIFVPMNAIAESHFSPQILYSDVVHRTMHRDATAACQAALASSSSDVISNVGAVV